MRMAEPVVVVVIMLGLLGLTSVGCKKSDSGAVPEEKNENELLVEAVEAAKKGAEAEETSFGEASTHYEAAVQAAGEILSDFPRSELAGRLSSGDGVLDGRSLSELRELAEATRMKAKAEETPLECARFILDLPSTSGHAQASIASTVLVSSALASSGNQKAGKALLEKAVQIAEALPHGESMLSLAFLVESVQPLERSVARKAFEKAVQQLRKTKSLGQVCPSVITLADNCASLDTCKILLPAVLFHAERIGEELAQLITLQRRGVDLVALFQQEQKMTGDGTCALTALVHLGHHQRARSYVRVARDLEKARRAPEENSQAGRFTMQLEGALAMWLHGSGHPEEAQAALDRGLSLFSECHFDVSFLRNLGATDSRLLPPGFAQDAANMARFKAALRMSYCADLADMFATAIMVAGNEDTVNKALASFSSFMDDVESSLTAAENGYGVGDLRSWAVIAKTGFIALETAHVVISGSVPQRTETTIKEIEKQVRAMQTADTYRNPVQRAFVQRAWMWLALAKAGNPDIAEFLPLVEKQEDIAERAGTALLVVELLLLRGRLQPALSVFKHFAGLDTDGRLAGTILQFLVRNEQWPEAVKLLPHITNELEKATALLNLIPWFCSRGELSELLQQIKKLKLSPLQAMVLSALGPTCGIEAKSPSPPEVVALCHQILTNHL